MKITVAIPSYNKEKFIDRCIQSALIEKKYIERIILVDNASTDKTFELSKKYEPEITCFQNEKNLGMAKNWNVCIDLCTTQWLLILHADDELLPNSISKYIDLTQRHPTVGLIHANSYSVVEGNEATRSFAENNQKEFWRAGLDAMSCNYGVCSAVMVRKDVYTKLGYFVESLSSDAEMWSRIAAHYDVGFIQEPTAVYHVSKSSTGYDSLVNRNVKDIKKDWDFLTEQIASHYPTEETRQMYLHTSKKNAPNNYWSLVTANIRAKNYRKVAHVLYLILFVYNGFFPLLRLIFLASKKKLTRLFN